MKRYPYHKYAPSQLPKGRGKNRGFQLHHPVALVVVTLAVWLVGNPSIIAPTQDANLFSPLYFASEAPDSTIRRHVSVPRNSLIRSTVAMDRHIRGAIATILESYPMGIPEVDKTDLAQHLIEQARLYNFDPFFILSVMFAESGLDNYAVSSVGALGLMQIMPATARLLATELRFDMSKKAWTDHKLFEPKINIQLGVYYLHQLKKDFGYNMHHYLAAYNEGPAAVNSKLRRGITVESNYTVRILSFYHHFAMNPTTKPFTSLALY